MSSSAVKRKSGRDGDKPGSLLTVLFADISGSTRLYEQLGDQRARETIGRTLATLGDIGRKNGGTLVKTIGDEVMFTFESADAAARAACEMQQTVNSQAVLGQSIAIRVGFHAGPALMEDGDVFGDAVNIAARIADLAKSGQVLTTSTTFALLPSEWHSQNRQVDRTGVRGKSGQIVMIELLWQQEGVTRAVAETWAGTGGTARLVLTHGRRRIELSRARPLVIIGRSDVHDLAVKHELVSRLHARIEYRKEKFTLTDQSTNGTWVQPEGGKRQFIRRESQVLTGSGLIGLGEEVDKDSPNAIHYRLG
jgi:class 3 adenylate cyclase